MSIFTENKIYPEEETPLKEHFSEFYDSVYVASLPFFRIENETKSKSFKASEKITVEQAKAEMKELKSLKLENVEIFTSNKDYPKEKEIYENGVLIKWKEIVSNTELSDSIELNRALKTSIGAYKKKLERQDLLKTLNHYTDLEKIWHPSEGGFDLFTKKKIYQAFKNFNKDIIIIVDEFFENTVELDLTKLSEYEFIDKIDYKDYYIYSSDREILFTIEWDSYFCLVAVDKNKIEYIENHFEGFIADEKTTHLWDW
ncbi:DUF2711 family protein [Zunongwangia profunda]|uniref:DUF2711 domain-containing protein n=1 Tax=Zunongwangia profunda (strain DSM 18752 / CCTCC AB 206139 / SM-A87) TaxID=655815 RepID=D5BK82_ZUNPS|nr:DUF2711 family protein [Zunongwangia profunda]ADF51762.1 conserved hypothetical protein [Zunongwangia profunda SM-A87]|tara:strand:+ start:851 stop:1621 length:771 start_codon:yes stop_codon:yes gene_type:complete